MSAHAHQSSGISNSNPLGVLNFITNTYPLGKRAARATNRNARMETAKSRVNNRRVGVSPHPDETAPQIASEHEAALVFESWERVGKRIFVGVTRFARN